MNKIEKIPRIIHYCWFGRGEKPSLVRKCIASWKKHLAGYEFIEWNEDNFDISSNIFVQQAYNAKKYAFVSDYVRVHALYHFGGIYLDTDVEVLKPFNGFLSHDSFWGFEDSRYIATSTIGTVKGHKIIEDFLEYYKDRNFIKSDGSYDFTTNVSVITDMFIKQGLIPDGTFQVLENQMAVYPRTYFCPYDYINGEDFITAESYTLHHFAKSWLPLHVRLRGKGKNLLAKLIGGKRVAKLRNLISSM